MSGAALDRPLLGVAGSPTTTAGASAASTSASTSGRGKCWGWWASRARARRRCSMTGGSYHRQRRVPDARGHRGGRPPPVRRSGDILARTDWGMVHQNPRDGLRMNVTAGADVGERLMAVGARHLGQIRAVALEWLGHVEIATDRRGMMPRHLLQQVVQQRLQIARNLVTRPRLVLMDEPTGGLDVSVQARLLDLLRSLVAELGLSAIVVTHDLAVTRLLTHRLLVLRRGEVVESGLTDQVLDDPQHAYTQLLVSSVLHP